MELTNNKIECLDYYIKKYSSILKCNIVANFHHFKSKLLSDNALLNAIRLLYTRVDSDEIKGISKETIKSFNGYIFLKLSILVFILIYTGWFFSQVVFLGLLIVLIIDVSLALFNIFIWWRSVLFGISRRKLIKTPETVLVSPFKGVKFYTIRKFPYSLFMHIDNRLLIGMKMVNLKYMYKSYYCKFDRFIEALNNYSIHFTYTLRNEPLYYYYFEKYGLNSIHEKIKHNILFHPRYKIKKGVDEEEWLAFRKGIW